MKIIKLTAENVKKLVAVEITPSGNVVEITGKNEQGKTSVLDSIWWALEGASHIQAVPIRKGANKAKIRLDLGELVVTRRFNKGKAGGATTSIVVENADGQKQTSPQTILNGLIGELSFDPLAFARMDGKQQFETMKRFVPGVDFEAIAKANDEDYQKRTELNREAKSVRAQADGIFLPKDVPDEAVDEAALVEQLQKAGEHNTLIEQKKANRARLTSDVEGHKQAAEELHARAGRVRKEAEDLAARMARDADALEDQAKDRMTKAIEIDQRLQQAGPLADPIDPTEVREKIASARTANEAIAKRNAKQSLLKTHGELEADSAALTRSMDNREIEKRKAIEAAQMPVEGLGFGDGEVLLSGLPFDQASDAERLRVSVAIAMAANPKLRVIRVRDGSLLDEDAMKLLGQMADAEDYQVWIERVDPSGKSAVVLQDGRVKEKSDE